MCSAGSSTPRRRTANGVPTSHILWIAEGWLYAAAVMVLFSRLVVGWSMSVTMIAQLATNAQGLAIWRRGVGRTVLHHSDQGGQYRSALFHRLLADHGVICNISRAGNSWTMRWWRAFSPC